MVRSCARGPDPDFESVYNVRGQVERHSILDRLAAWSDPMKQIAWAPSAIGGVLGGGWVSWRRRGAAAKAAALC